MVLFHTYAQGFAWFWNGLAGADFPFARSGRQRAHNRQSESEFRNAGATGFTLTISGSGLPPGATVQMGSSVLATTLVNATEVTALVPAGIIRSPGNLLGEVVNPGGSASGLFSFTVNPQARLSIVTASLLPSGTVGTPYSLALAATGGMAPTKAGPWRVKSSPRTVADHAQ
jgi:hypothetical protein